MERITARLNTEVDLCCADVDWMDHLCRGHRRCVVVAASEAADAGYALREVRVLARGEFRELSGVWNAPIGTGETVEEKVSRLVCGRFACWFDRGVHDRSRETHLLQRVEWDDPHCSVDAYRF